jgi:hypothetical protein
MGSRRRPFNQRQGSSVTSLLVGAAVLGAVVGIGSIATTGEGRKKLASTAKDVGVAAGMVRRRSPQPGDHWPGCNEARAAGTVPIYRGEPGYSEEMDGDGDGEACEPYH